MCRGCRSAVDCLDCSHCLSLRRLIAIEWRHSNALTLSTGAIYEIVTMTNWLPDLSHGSGPLYVRLAERIEDGHRQRHSADGHEAAAAARPRLRHRGDNRHGRPRLCAGARARAGQRRGRARYIRARPRIRVRTLPPAAVTGRSGGHARPSLPGKLRMDSTSAPAVGQGEAIERLTGQIFARRIPTRSSTIRACGRASWQEAGSRWLTMRRLDAGPAIRSCPTLGAHAAVLGRHRRDDRAGRQDRLSRN